MTIEPKNIQLPPNVFIILGLMCKIFFITCCATIETIPVFIGFEDINEALINATINIEKENIILLLDKGADINTKTAYGYTPLHIAAFQGNREIVELFLARGSDKNARSNNGETPFSLALSNGYYETANLLIGYSIKDTLKKSVLLQSQQRYVKVPKQFNWSKLLQSIPSFDNYTIKLGIGNPYGLVGINAEAGYHQFSGSFGFSSVENITTWAIGGRAYLSMENTTFRPRLGFFYGVIDIYSDSSGDYDYTERRAVIGYSFTVGFEYRKEHWCFDIDLVFPYKLKKFKDYASYPLLPSFGVGISL